MGIIRGSATFTRFTVTEPLPEDYIENFPNSILRYAFRPLGEDSDAERSAGWVNILDMFDSQFNAMEFFKDPYIAMSLRIDARSVPSKALKQYCRDAEEDIRIAENLPFLNRERRLELKEIIHARLLRRAIPRSNTYDMIWNLDTGVVLFGSVNSKLSDEFSEMFLKTFGMNVNPLFPYSLGLAAVEKERLSPGRIDEIVPLNLGGYEV